MSIVHRHQSVDNAPRYTKSQAAAGGRISGECRRRKAAERHAEVRRLRREGLTLRAISDLTRYAISTVSRILTGVIASCLTVPESMATPWKPAPQPAGLRELNYGTQLTGAGGFRARLRRRAGKLRPHQPETHDGPACTVCRGRGWLTQVCPCCGRADPAPFRELRLSVERAALDRPGFRMPHWWDDARRW